MPCATAVAERVAQQGAADARADRGRVDPHREQLGRRAADVDGAEPEQPVAVDGDADDEALDVLGVHGQLRPRPLQELVVVAPVPLRPHGEVGERLRVGGRASRNRAIRTRLAAPVGSTICGRVASDRPRAVGGRSPTTANSGVGPSTSRRCQTDARDPAASRERRHEALVALSPRASPSQLAAHEPTGGEGSPRRGRRVPAVPSPVPDAAASCVPRWRASIAARSSAPSAPRPRGRTSPRAIPRPRRPRRGRPAAATRTRGSPRGGAADELGVEAARARPRRRRVDVRPRAVPEDVGDRHPTRKRRAWI